MAAGNYKQYRLKSYRANVLPVAKNIVRLYNAATGKSIRTGWILFELISEFITAQKMHRRQTARMQGVVVPFVQSLKKMCLCKNIDGNF